MASDAVINPDTSSGLLGVASGSTEELLRRVIRTIKQDVVSADLKWSLMVAASQSYKWDSSLRPFPPIFLVNGIKDLKLLLLAIEAVPPFLQLIQMSPVTHLIPRDAVELLHWTLVESQDPWLSVVDKSKVDEVMGLVASVLTAPPPKLIVKIHYNSSNASERRWSSLSQEYPSVFAFHGSRVLNFHSIIHYGLQQHLTKTALFGQGVYLSSELLVCLPYSRNGFGWAHSCIGHEISIVALCEIIDHPTVKCQSGLEQDRSRATAEDSEAGELPHKMYVVPNSELLKVRYLLVYSSANPNNKAASVSERPLRYRYGGNIIHWIAQHKMAFLLLVYSVLLASIGLSRSPMFFRFWRRICIKFGFK